MKLYRVSSQKNKYEKFESFLRKDITELVRFKPSVCNALIKFGLLTDLVDSIPAHHHNGTLPDSQAMRRAIILQMISWNSPPTLMVMSDTGTAWGRFLPGSGNIIIYKDLVEKWEKYPTDKVLLHGLAAVVLHEMVHYLNDLIMPNSKFNIEPGHLRADFHKEAFEPLGWDSGHYLVIKEVLMTKGVIPPK